ncbi:MAG: DUF7379 domain-containing protein [Gemmatimonadaceae bacterium]
MPQLQLAEGLTLTHPETVEASAAPGGTRRSVTRTRRGRNGAAAAPDPVRELDPLVSALGAQGLELVGQFELAPRPERRSRGTRRSRAAAPGTEGPSAVELQLGSNEDAVVLTVDTNEEVDWVLPSGQSLTAPTRAARGGKRGARQAPADGPRRVTFRIETAERAAARPGATRRTRGPVLKAAKGVVGFVFKFAREKITEKLISHLEKSVVPGLVRVSSNVSADWTRLGPDGVLPAVPARSADGIPRVLLLIHGTFSSTIGSYGGLSFSDGGLALLNGAQQKYDHIIGWDHRTLSEEPMPNAREIFDTLNRLFGDGGAVIDAVGYSRGGLVLRSLLEQHVPGTKWEGKFNQAVFVGCTLNGTKLAQEKNWKAFVTIYTNIAIAACRGVRTLIPPAAVATVWVETVARGVSVLVRFLATALLDKGGIPGLVAMDPDKDVVKKINARALPPGLAGIYRAVTNDFEPGLPSPEGEVLPASFKIRAADLIMDAQMRGPNDLVVNTSSMDHVGLGALPTAQVLALPQNGRTIHTSYFRDPDVVTQLRVWLLGEADTRAPRAVRTTRGALRAPGAGSRRSGVKRTTATKRAVVKRTAKKRTAVKPLARKRASVKPAARKRATTKAVSRTRPAPGARTRRGRKRAARA